ncbi:hypothetical protein LCGC14_0141440 [marine sediment metagenome]|uniref:DUF4326 domain-containing protein n=1 Tax=marine sediment metagenome TaxID=412755 RepID=A0A0F9VGE9_9ZZZZ
MGDCGSFFVRYRTMKTTTVNIRRSEYDVYIGRAGHGHDGIFGNPFSGIRDGGREKAIALYRKYFLERLKNDQEFVAQVEKLKGKRLGCFCKPKACHGDVIVEYLEKPMKVVICGDRNWSDESIICERLHKLPSDTIIIQGECDGADTLAGDLAREIGLDVVGFYANWTRHGKAAGPIRNIRMLNTKPSLVIAFHNDLSKSKGTKHIVNEARKRGIEVEVIEDNVE